MPANTTAVGPEGDDASNRVELGMEAAKAYADEHSRREPDFDRDDRPEVAGGYAFDPLIVGKVVSTHEFVSSPRRTIFPMRLVLRKPDPPFITGPNLN